MGGEANLETISLGGAVTDASGRNLARWLFPLHGLVIFTGLQNVRYFFRPSIYMGYPLRIFSRPRSVVSEITQVTFQHRSLIRPGLRLNPLIIGALAKAQALYPLQLHGFIFLSTHFHIEATFSDAQQMARFMGHFTTNLSKIIGAEHDWKDSVFPKRYHHVELSEEPGVDLARLRYVTQNSCKENLVMSPLDWPGVSSAEALITGEPLKGVWIDRTDFFRARQRGEDVIEADFTEHLELHLSPIPSLAHLSSRAYRDVMIDMIREIEEETLRRHRENGTVPLGVQAILSRRPDHRPSHTPSSPRPWFHALSRKTRKAMRAALTWIIVAYRDATDRLKAGELDVEFPEGTFPPARPFVSFRKSLAPG